MKKCLACGNLFQTSDWACPNCGNTPGEIAGFLAFAPEQSNISDGFEEGFFEGLFELEAGNFWFQARSALAKLMMKTYFPSVSSILEIGCGTGYMLSQLESEFPGASLSGSEILCNGLAYASRRVTRAALFQIDATRLPFEDEFEVICAFDVIEHITEDDAVLSEMHRAVRKGGGIILTVPQHMWLWSYADEHAHHKRRYSAKELRGKVEAAGFRVVRMTSFVSLLLPLMMASRLRNRRPDQHYDDTNELRLSKPLNYLFGRMMDMERMLIKMGVTLPAGGSLILVGKKV